MRTHFARAPRASVQHRLHPTLQGQALGHAQGQVLSHRPAPGWLALASALLASALAGCAASGGPGAGGSLAAPGPAVASSPAGETLVQPYVAIQAAAADPLRGLPGTFVLQVQNVNRLDNSVYINSEGDSRDQRNLAIVVRRDALAGLEATYGAPLEKSLWGKRLLVNGVAKRVRIDFTVDGTPSGKYYYQTHVEVRDASQVRVQPVG